MWEAHNWSKTGRLCIGAFTLLPVLICITIAYNAFRDPSVGASVERGGTGVLAIGLLLFTGMLMLVVYVPSVLNNARIGRGPQGLWIAGFLFLGVVTMPVYWLQHVWRAPLSPDDGI